MWFFEACNKGKFINSAPEINAEIQRMQRFTYLLAFCEFISMHLCMIYIKTRSTRIIQTLVYNISTGKELYSPITPVLSSFHVVYSFSYFCPSIDSLSYFICCSLNSSVQNAECRCEMPMCQLECRCEIWICFIIQWIPTHHSHIEAVIQHLKLPYFSHRWIFYIIVLLQFSVQVFF